MPRYVTKLDDDEGQGRYAVYSTVVDNLVSGEMGEVEMYDHLVVEGQRWWLDPDRPRHMLWWNGLFWYAKLSEAFYVLPRESWSNG